MLSDPMAGDSGSSAFQPINVNGLANSAVQAFGIYEAGQTTKKAVGNLSGTTLAYVVLGLAGAVILGIVVLKH